MNRDLNKVLLNRRDAIFVAPIKSERTDQEYKMAIIATASKNLESLGYRISANLANSMTGLPIQEIVETATFLTDAVKERLGGDVEYHPMYPGFPESVLSRTEAQLYFDALVYAMTGFEVLPFDTEREKGVKEDARELSALKIIDLADIRMIKDIVSNLMASPVAFSQDDKDDLMTIRDNFQKFGESIPKIIPNKENLTWLAAKEMENGNQTKNPFLAKMDSATDILRLIVARNGGDTSLTSNIKFQSLPTMEVRAYAKRLLDMEGIEPDMYNRREMFKKVFESYHFRNMNFNRVTENKAEALEYKKRMGELLDRLYQNKLERSFLSKRDFLVKENDFINLLSIYKENPGQMGADIANLALMACKQKDYRMAKAALCTAYQKNSHKMSTQSLLRVEAVLRDRTDKKPFAVYAPKKGLVNPYMKEDTRDPIPKNLEHDLCAITKTRLRERYSQKRPLGKVFIEEGLKDIKIPSQQRAASKGSTGRTYGSRYKIGDGIKNIRSFIWWTNSDRCSQVDIDLSAAMYDHEYQNKADISYYDLTGSGLGVHSGDLRDGGPKGGKGAAEFIDVNLDDLKQNKIAYVMFSVRIYSGENFADTPCKFGWMESDRIPAKLFDISKVEEAVQLNAESTRAVMAVLDVDSRKMVWLDRSPREMSDFKITSLFGGNNNITYASSDMVEAYRAVNLSTQDLYTLLSLHAESRGEIVESPEEADTIFTVDKVNKEDYPNAKEFVCSYDSDIILGDLVSDKLSALDEVYFKELEEAQRKAEAIAVHEADEGYPYEK